MKRRNVDMAPRHGFVAWRNKGKWEKASSDAGFGKPRGSQLSADAQAHYDRCDRAYQTFVAAVCAAAFSRFVAEFDALAKLYADYKRQAALLDFDDLLYHARDLLAHNEAVRHDLSRRYPRVLVDEFQDTDPLQAEILWRLCGEGAQETPWIDRALRAGSLFVVGDPKQAIYRFRGADVDTYLEAKHALRDARSGLGHRNHSELSIAEPDPGFRERSVPRASLARAGTTRLYGAGNRRVDRRTGAPPWRVSKS